MRRKTEKHSHQKAGKRKPAKPGPEPPAKLDKGHGEEVAPAKEMRNAQGNPKK
jgi:hypothetical protein